MGKPLWRFEGNERKYLDNVLSNGFKASADGSFNFQLENLWAKIHQAKYAITFNSCTSALHASLLALGCGPGDEVLVPALTPLMCGLTPYYTGATPVYVDSDKNTFLMDLEDMEKKITDKTKVILVVHMYGGVCNINQTMEIAKKHNVYVMEDCAQCVSGRDDKGNVTGESGVISCWSFENSKHLTCGDGGIAVCNDEHIATKLRKIGGLGFKILTAERGGIRVEREKFQDPKWERFDEIGYNFRLNELGAAVALAQAEDIEKYVKLRRDMGEGYREVLKNSTLLKSQFQPEGYYYTYYTFSARFIGDEEGISWYDFRRKHMEFGGDGIFAASKLLYQEPIFQNLNIGIGKTPIAEILQRCLMNFTTNQANIGEQNIQLEALGKALQFYGDIV